ncbi:copper transporter [Desmospora activa]|nr:copper transporter [Desmospora activa]
MRYHLVTLVAIFFALTIGILLGGSGGAWWEQSRQGMVETVLQQYQQIRQQNHQLQRELVTQHDHLNNWRKANHRLFQEAIRHRLEHRLVLLVGGSHRGESIEATIRKAGAAVERKTIFPHDVERFDAIIVLSPLSQTSRHDRHWLSDARLVFDGPIVICQRWEKDRPVLAAKDERIWFLLQEEKGNPERLVSMISWLADAIQPKGEPL